MPDELLKLDYPGPWPVWFRPKGGSWELIGTWPSFVKATEAACTGFESVGGSWTVSLLQPSEPRVVNA